MRSPGDHGTPGRGGEPWAWAAFALVPALVASCSPATPSPETEADWSAVAEGHVDEGPLRIDKAFCEGPGQGWFDSSDKADGGGSYPYVACGDGGFRVPAGTVEVFERRGSTIEFRVVADGHWTSQFTALQELDCVARLCGPGQISIESRFCFSRLPSQPGRGVTSLDSQFLSAFCTAAHVPPGHYTATADGVAVQFDSPRKIDTPLRIRARRRTPLRKPTRPSLPEPVLLSPSSS